MEKFGNFRKKIGDNARKATVAALAAAAPFASTPASAQNKNQSETVAQLTKNDKKISRTYEKEKSTDEIVRELFIEREIKPNQGEDFLKKVDFWDRQHSEGGPNYQSLKDGWARLLDSDKKKQSDLQTVFSIFKKNGVPKDLIFLALAESYWRNATSIKGASGPWQFMPDTAARFGLKDRSNVTESTEAACKYLKSLYQMTEECAQAAGVSISESDAWEWAFLAYNRGEGAVLWTPKKHTKGDFFKYKGDINEYIKNCNVKESVNYPTKIMAIAKVLGDMEINKQEVANLEK